MTGARGSCQFLCVRRKCFGFVFVPFVFCLCHCVCVWLNECKLYYACVCVCVLQILWERLGLCVIFGEFFRFCLWFFFFFFLSWRFIRKINPWMTPLNQRLGSKLHFLTESFVSLLLFFCCLSMVLILFGIWIFHSKKKKILRMNLK